MAGAFGKLQAYMFAIILSRPFEDWDAFKLGIIDIKGNILKKAKTKEEKKSLDAFSNLIRKIKKLLIKYIPDNKLFQFIIAAYLLKAESKNELFLHVLDNLSEKEQKTLYNILDKSKTVIL
jgi:hypothetical protein